MRPGAGAQVGPRQGGLEVSAGRRVAHAALLRHLVAPHPFLGRAVEVVVGRKPHFLKARRDGVADFMGVAAVLDVQRPARAVKGVCAVLVVLGLDEVRQHLVVAPAPVARCGPGVVVGLVAPDVDHRVDAARPTQHLAARPVEPSSGQVRLGFGLVIPVERRLEEFGEGRRNADFRRFVRHARFEQQHPHAGVLAQPGGHRAAARTPRPPRRNPPFPNLTAPCLPGSCILPAKGSWTEPPSGNLRGKAAAVLDFA